LYSCAKPVMARPLGSRIHPLPAPAPAREFLDFMNDLVAKYQSDVREAL
jgi:hypothetical protein